MIPTSATETRHVVASATIPASGTPRMLAIVFIPMTVEIAAPRSRYGNVSATVALMFGKITAAPAPATTRAAMMRGNDGAAAAATVARPITTGPPTRNGLRPIQSENGPAMRATTTPGAPYAATTSPTTPAELPNSSASCSSTGDITRPL